MTSVQAQQVAQELRAALESTDYNEARSRLSIATTQRTVHVSDVDPVPVPPTVWGVPERMVDKRRDLTTRRLNILGATTVGAWCALTARVPGGIVYDRGRRRLAVALLCTGGAQLASARDRHGDLVVAAGRQGRGLEVATAPALVRRHAWTGDWRVVRWLAWKELPDSAVMPYVAALQLDADWCATSALTATQGRPGLAAARAYHVGAMRASFCLALGERNLLTAKLRGFAYTPDELRALRDQADEAIVEYSRSDAGELAGCTAECGACPGRASCTARQARDTRHSAVTEYAITRKRLALADDRVETLRACFLAYGCLPEEFDPEAKGAHGQQGA